LPGKLKLTKGPERRNMSGLYQLNLIAGWGGVPTNASPAPKRVPETGDMHKNRSAAAATAGCVGIPRITPDDRRSTKKNILMMTLAPLRALAFCFFCSLCRTLYLRL
jgi:hypothetical protein